MLAAYRRVMSGSDQLTAAELERMRFLFYTHSLVSDWNHGNAHFLARCHARTHPARPRGP